MNTTTEAKMETKACYCGATTGLEFFCHVTGSRWVCIEKVACGKRTKAKKEAELNALLSAAMIKAGVVGVVGVAAVSVATDNTDPYADYTGYVVTSESSEIETRAVKWLSAWVAKNTKSTYSYTGMVSMMNGMPFIIESRYSLGE